MKRDRRRKYRQCNDDQFRKAERQKRIAMERWDKRLATPVPCVPGDLAPRNRAAIRNLAPDICRPREGNF